ncbi:MAG: symmetrical bis(5'-nucleosyl)-tetraphosphatase [Burkholderiales bacterium]|nr:MAG: symmetrical bis(5'-nucleosyl)-tetraphosphatase [Burkholderiales bacterium]
MPPAPATKAVDPSRTSPAATPRYLIGDLQGCHGAMQALLARLAAEPEARLWFVGDLVNRGPESLATLRAVRALGERAVAVLGNHDLHLLAVAAGVRPLHADDTLAGILEAPDAADLIDWVRSLPLAVLEDDLLMVHAGVLPAWGAERTVALAAEVQAALAGPQWVQFLRRMYGNEPDRWSDTLSGADRLRVIVNALTRLRFVGADGRMLLRAKGPPASAPPGSRPWFEAPDRATRDVTVVFGHWSTLGLVLEDNLIGLDTGCVWGGQLTAVRLPDRRVLQVDCPRYQAPGE